MALQDICQPTQPRLLSQHLLDHQLARQPDTKVKYRDLRAHLPKPVDHAWISAAFSQSESTDEQRAAQVESDALIDGLLWADLLVIGTSTYNFGMPANLKAWVDNIVRVRRTLLDDPNPVDPKHPFISVPGDGRRNGYTSFQRPADLPSKPPRTYALKSAQVLPGDMLWVRYAAQP